MKKEDIEKEIEASEKALESMRGTVTKCKKGIEIQEFVRDKFKDELSLI